MMVRKKILLYLGGRYSAIERIYQYFKEILNDYQIDKYENVDIFDKIKFFDYDTTIFFSQEGDLSPSQETNLLKFISSGKGFIGLHGASASFKSHPKYFEMLGGKFIGHKKIGTFDIIIIDKGHPITKDLDDFPFDDEPYRHDFSMGGKIHILAEADYHDQNDPNLEPIIWVRSFGKGKIFFCALGHRTRSLKDDIFRGIIKRAVKWILGDLN
ncbi:MAG: ThuA domain-containing protein [Candidatus Hodarchaeota archaeon]